MLKLNLFEIINALAVLILAAFIAYAKYKEKKLTKENALLENPERCKDHEDRLRKIEGIIPAWAEIMKIMARDISEIKAKLK